MFLSGVSSRRASMESMVVWASYFSRFCLISLSIILSVSCWMSSRVKALAERTECLKSGGTWSFPVVGAIIMEGSKLFSSFSEEEELTSDWSNFDSWSVTVSISVLVSSFSAYWNAVSIFFCSIANRSLTCYKSPISTLPSFYSPLM